MSYRVMLIDDEPWTIVYLKRTFRWEERGFQVVAEVQDAHSALSAAQSLRPDVIFTDIRMPGMTGLELIKAFKACGIASEFVIVSGFAEFTYAQEAIMLGAFEYCLKPINPQQADDLLVRLSDRLGGESQIEQATEITLDCREERNIHFEDMLSYIETRLHEKLRLKALARQFYMNPNYCCHLFNKHLGKTFSEHLTELRMKEASRILLNKHLTIDEVGRQAGYPDYFYFNKVFKKFYGVTPSEYRKEALTR